MPVVFGLIKMLCWVSKKQFARIFRKAIRPNVFEKSAKALAEFEKTLE